jgi:hypothetical protein
MIMDGGSFNLNMVVMDLVYCEFTINDEDRGWSSVVGHCYRDGIDLHDLQLPLWVMCYYTHTS